MACLRLIISCPAPDRAYSVAFPFSRYARCARLAHALDGFIEAIVDGFNDPKVINAFCTKVDAIIGKYGGEYGPVEQHNKSFSDVFGEIPRCTGYDAVLSHPSR